MLLVEEMPAEERIRKGNVMYRTRDARCRRHAGAAAARRGRVDCVRGGAAGGREGPVVARRRSRARARASRRPRSACLRSRVVGAGGQPGEGRSSASSCGRNRCRRWSSPIACATCRCSISRTSTSCSGWRGWAGRCATKRAARCTTRGAAVHAVQFLLDGQRGDRRSPDGTHDVRAPAALGVEELLEGAPMRADDDRGATGDHVVAVDRRVPRAAVGERRARRRASSAC